MIIIFIWLKPIIKKYHSLFDLQHLLPLILILLLMITDILQLFGHPIHHLPMHFPQLLPLHLLIKHNFKFQILQYVVAQLVPPHGWVVGGWGEEWV